MDSHTYKYFNKWFDQFNSNKIANEIENVAAVNIEIKIIKDLIDMFEKSLKQKKAQLHGADVQLNNADQERWTTRDAFCSQVWKFSFEHDFLKIFEHYPYMINPIKFHNCSYNTTTNENIKDEFNGRAEIENNKHIQKLEKEIMILKKEIQNVDANNNTKVVIQNLSIQLENLKQSSEEIMELLKLIHTTEYLDDDQKFNKNGLKCKNNKLLTIENKDNMLTFTKAKILIEQHNSYSHVLKEKNIMTSKMIMKNNNITEHLISDDKKQLKSKFAVKTQSKMSLKFEQKRYLKEKQKEC